MASVIGCFQLQVPDYYDIIKEPMDFGTMRKKIKKGSYITVEEFEVRYILVLNFVVVF